MPRVPGMCITALRAEVHACTAEVHIHTHALILPKSCEASTVPFDPVGLVPVGLVPVGLVNATQSTVQQPPVR